MKNGNGADCGIVSEEDILVFGASLPKQGRSPRRQKLRAGHINARAVEAVGRNVRNAFADELFLARIIAPVVAVQMALNPALLQKRLQRRPVPLPAVLSEDGLKVAFE